MKNNDNTHKQLQNDIKAMLSDNHSNSSKEFIATVLAIVTESAMNSFVNWLNYKLFYPNMITNVITENNENYGNQYDIQYLLDLTKEEIKDYTNEKEKLLHIIEYAKDEDLLKLKPLLEDPESVVSKIVDHPRSWSGWVRNSILSGKTNTRITLENQLSEISETLKEGSMNRIISTVSNSLFKSFVIDSKVGFFNNEEKRTSMKHDEIYIENNPKFKNCRRNSF